LVQLSPRKHNAQLSAPERALDHLERVDLHLRAAVGVPGMEVAPVVATSAASGTSMQRGSTSAGDILYDMEI
jgi:hypothetical protein